MYESPPIGNVLLLNAWCGLLVRFVCGEVALRDGSMGLSGKCHVLSDSSAKFFIFCKHFLHI